MSHRIADWLPILRWAPGYSRQHAGNDLTAAATVMLLLIPQSMAYALLAGLPAVTGLYASMLPLVVYALMGSSPALGVGPAALRSIMSLAAVGAVVTQGSADFMAASLLLAVMVGTLLLIMGALRMGFVAGFLSHPVLSGFVTASGLLIAMSQWPHVWGVPLSGQNLAVFVQSWWHSGTAFNGLTLAVGLGTMLWLGLSKRWLQRGLLLKAVPLLTMAVAIVLTEQLGWAAKGLAVVGDIPSGAMPWTLGPVLGVSWNTTQALLVPALLIAVMTFVEQVSIAQSLAAKRRERIDTNTEMVAMGGANLAAGLTGGFAVGASFSRSVVNDEAGARTPMAGLFTAVLLLITALFFTPWLSQLPLAVLAATILMALGSLLNFGSFAKTWRYSRADFAAQALTFGVTLLVDLVSGLMAGVVASLLLHIWHSSRPHIATVGHVPGTEHYRNVLRHEVITHPEVLGLRPDESLFFANARFLEDHVAAAVAAQPAVRHVVLQCNAINDIDASGLESLQTIDQRLREQGIALHLSEVKGPVMDRLQRSDWLQNMSGQVFLTHHQAVTALVGPNAS
ncbi:SUL1 Sulfate permease and related transporters (MFS superfamily) [Burkholderiaceae bacterium]